MKKILLNGFSSLGFAIPILYEIFVLIDSWIYALAAFAMQAFFAIAKLQLSTENINDISYITSRIMLLCGVYALFKLSITLINCIIDPNKIEKSGKSGTKIVQRIVIAVVLLASSKFIFDELFAFQNVVIDSNVIPKIIYGDANYNDENDGDMALTSKKFVNSVFVTLFENNTAETSPSEAAKTAKNRVLQGESILLLSPYAYDAGFHYIPFVTGIVGILLCYYFIAFAFELGTRIIKLFVLQVISPIPIIMSIDPSSKSDKLVNFAKLYGGIYLNVFVRILTVYVAFVALNLVTSVFDGINWLAKILLIIGVFHAAKELPKLIEDALGIKLGLGDAGKGFGAVLKGTIAGGAGLVGGAIAGGISGGAGGALSGAFSGLTTGVTKGAAAKNAVGVIGASTGAIKGGFGMGARVAGAGGLGAFMVGGVENFFGGFGMGARVAGAGGLGAFILGGVENFFGGKGKDAATISKFDEDIKDTDKAINNIKKNMDISNKGNDMRNNIENVMNRNYERTHGTLEDMLSNNSDIQSIQERIANAQNDTDRSVAMSELANKRNELTNEYNSQKDAYFSSQLNMADPNFNGPIGQDTAELRQLINDYNDYVDKNGLTDRKITDLSSLSKSKQEYEKVTKAYENDIKKNETKKKNIEKSKSDFVDAEKNPGYNRRNNRDSKPQYSSRNVNNNNNTNGGNTN